MRTQTEFKHLGRFLTKKQCAALLFALSEGEVGPGANAYYYGAYTVRSPTIRYLIGAGLATHSPLKTPGGRWVVLTLWGKEVAQRIKDTRDSH